MINFVVLWKDKAIFWNTVPSHYGKAAKTLFSLTKEVIESVEERLIINRDGVMGMEFFVFLGGVLRLPP